MASQQKPINLGWIIDKHRESGVYTDNIAHSLFQLFLENLGKEDINDFWFMDNVLKRMRNGDYKTAAECVVYFLVKYEKELKEKRYNSDLYDIVYGCEQLYANDLAETHENPL